ncbi:MAG: TonB-dependent receptor [Candidatus Omnitrophica bacterium]|nr:TonB-dependent receptor [Candidatus Omnitrophota bacterium]
MRKKIIVLLGMLMLLMPKDIYAAEKKDAKQLDLGQINVTASRVERGRSEVSSSVSIITAKDIKASNAKSIPDLLKNLEGIYTYDSSGVGTTGRINMRGFWGGMSTHQVVLIDGIPQNKGNDKLVDWDLIALDNIEKVEVVRGPACALYGDNAMSGVINIITKNPRLGSQTKAAYSYGSFETHTWAASASGTVADTGYYLGLGGKATEGFRRHNDYEAYHINGKVNFVDEESRKLSVFLDYRDREIGAHPWALTEAQIAQDRRQARPGSESDKTETGRIDLGATYRADITEAAEADATAYYRSQEERVFYTSGASVATTKEQLEEENTAGLLLRATVNNDFFNRQNSLTAGVDLESNDVDYEEYAAPAQVQAAISQDYRVKRTSVGPYLQYELELFEPLKLITGLRHDDVKFDFTDYRAAANSKKVDMSKTTPKYGLAYSYQEESNLYFNYAKAFRTPTLGHLFTYGTSSNFDLEPEKAISYEAGIYHRINDYLKANAAVYWMDLDNEIWYDSSAKQYKNYGETSHKGADAGVQFKIDDGLGGFLNYSWLRAKNESGTYEDNYLTNVPKQKGSLGINLGKELGWQTSWVLNYNGASYIDSANNNRLTRYITVDAKLGYQQESRRLFFEISNLFDKKYNSYGFMSGTTKYFNPAPGRVFNVGIEVGF